MISPALLWKFYKKEGIRYSRISYIKKSKLTKQNEIKEKQFDFSIKLTEFKMDCREIYYIDQTSFNVW